MIDAKALLDYVDHLSSNKEFSSEAHSRTLMSRIYYSVFYRCRDLVKQLDISLVENLNSGSHKVLYTSMKKWANDNDHNKELAFLVRAIAQDAERLKQKRTIADYKTEIFFPPNDAIAAIAKARHVHSKIDAILSD